MQCCFDSFRRGNAGAAEDALMEQLPQVRKPYTSLPDAGKIYEWWKQAQTKKLNGPQTEGPTSVYYVPLSKCDAVEKQLKLRRLNCLRKTKLCNLLADCEQRHADVHRYRWWYRSPLARHFYEDNRNCEDHVKSND